MTFNDVKPKMPVYVLRMEGGEVETSTASVVSISEPYNDTQGKTRKDFVIEGHKNRCYSVNVNAVTAKTEDMKMTFCCDLDSLFKEVELIRQDAILKEHKRADTELLKRFNDTDCRLSELSSFVANL